MKEFSDIEDGISRNERYLEALDPSYVEIEGREIPDFISFLSKLAAQFNYYNTTNRPDGTWEDFFRSDANVLIILLNRYDISAYFNDFNKYREAIKAASGDEERLNNLRRLFKVVLEITTIVERIYAEFLKTPDWSEVEDVLLTIRDISVESAKIKNSYLEAVSIYGEPARIEKFGVAQRPVQSYSNPEPIFNKAESLGENLERAIPFIASVFAEVQAKYNRLQQSAARYIQKGGLLEKTYSPQAALMITFLKLYDHLKRKMNGITKRHLDFYYKDLLGIPNLKAEQDKVHVLFDPDAGVSGVRLAKSELLQAFKPGIETPLLYALDGDLLVSRAAIAECKTIYVSDYPQILSQEFENVKEAQVCRRDNQVFNPAAYKKKPESFLPWSALGEDQQGLSGSMRTMEDAELGLVIASPLLYLPEGDRTVTLRFYFREAEFRIVEKHVRNYADVAKKGREMILAELLSTAFRPEYTGDAGWVATDAYFVKCYVEGPASPVVEITFTLDASMPALDHYSAKIHGPAYPVALPAVRLMINNTSPHNPYTYLRKLLVERITIRAKVDGFSSLRLQNNIGALSPVNPFQPFGPLPELGSFIDIKNTNVFNRYTRALTIHIEWLNLPRDAGGFAEYYKTYGLGFTNESFKVGVSALNGGSYSPAADKQQQFNLFESGENRQQLKNRTVADVNFSRIGFNNNPKLAGESLQPDMFFREGALRLELQAPGDAFGHRHFARIFPQAVMENAKKKKNKDPLPNQPFVPVIKSLWVDYETEHSENFKDSSSEADTGLVLFHHYPFGYEKVYPGNMSKSYPMMPQFDQESNLCIGLTGVEPGQELALLFQLEERNFHHTFHRPDALRWSYLDGNTWHELDRKDVLRDTTDNFITSGIVHLKLPRVVPQASTILNGSLFWIRASLKGSSSTQSRVLAIYTNAALAVRTSAALINEKDFTLLPGAITGFGRTIKGIQSVWQLFPSGGGRPREDAEDYYVRLSERLRHKNRPVLAQDIMQVILQQFPQIQMVKCFGAMGRDQAVIPGANLQVVVIPKELADGHFKSEEPQVSLATLYSVKKFLKKVISPFVKVEVGNPVYEKVKVMCRVMFSDMTAADHGYYERKLVGDINAYIAPWLYGVQNDMKMGNRIYRSDLLMFIKNRPYVSYVTGFSVVHFYSEKNQQNGLLQADVLDSAVKNADYIVASGAGAVLIPSRHHSILPLNKTGYAEPQKAGIGNLIIGEEFLVTDGESLPRDRKQERVRQVRDGGKYNMVIKHTTD